ncbi:YdcF family protein [Rubeoparvulum massiliense]|uniref:YdcF family protein n=1 Tax=Rubeoparvulum massiliense TaxID=1631346 RepID=UPI00065DE4E5|nr:YdcF family protein [Rubeoparvulum massiliense]
MKLRSLSPKGQRRLLTAGIVIIVVLLVIMLLKNPFLRWMGHQLVADDPLQPADVIVVLGGDMHWLRIEEAARLYHEGWAEYVLVSGGGQVTYDQTEYEAMRAHLIHLGVPVEKIWVETHSRSTYENAVYTRDVLSAKEKELGYEIKRMILVTIDWHTGRSSRTFKHVFQDDGVEIISHPANDPDFDPDHWWTDHEGQQRALMEWARNLVYLVKY